MKKKNFGVTFLASLLVIGSLVGCGSEKADADASDAAVNNAAETGEEGTAFNDAAGSNEEGVFESTIPAEGLTVRIADTDAWVVAQRAGFIEEEFAGENVSVELLSFNGGPYINEAIAGESLDFGWMAEQPALTAIANNYPEKIIACGGYSDKNVWIIASKESGITTLEELKDSSLGVILGGSLHYNALKLLSQVGLTDADVNLVNSTNEDSLAMLTSGDLQAAAVLAQYGLNAVENADCVKIADGEPYGIDSAYCIVAGDTFLEEHPDVTVRLLKVLDKAINYMNENPEEALQWVAEELQKDYDSLLTTFPYNTYTLTVSQRNIDCMESVGDFLEEYELIPAGSLDIEAGLDLTYLEAAGLLTEDLVFPE